MTPDDLQKLSARERQIMDALFRHEEASVSTIREELPDPPTASAIRTMLMRLANKGHVTSRREGSRNVYAPVRPREEAGRSAVHRLVATFFGGSATRTVAAILDEAAAELSEEELDRLARLVDEARSEEKRP